MSRARLAARVAAVAATCAVGVPMAIAATSAAAGTQTTTLTTAPVTTTTPAATPTTTVSEPTVRTPAAERATVKVGGPAAVAATSTTQGFLGISTSLSTVPALAGPPTDPDTPFVNLLKSLSPGAPPLLRIGGNAGDDSWWPIPGIKQRYLYKLTPQWGARVKALLTALGGKAIIGVTLKVDADVNSEIASTEVADFNRYVGASLIDAFELGNEPEFYPLSVVNGGRGHDTIAAYGKKFTQVASALGPVPLAGPSVVGPVWQSELGTLLNHLPSRLKLVTLHAYPLKNCSRLAQVSISDFFTPASITGLADLIHHTVEAARAHGKPLRLDEVNGITCGGKAGLSNSFGEALWALNVLPALWRTGVQGVNFQSVYGGFNQMIHSDRTAAGWTVSVEPEYYGLLAFADAAPAGSRLLRISNPGLPDFYQFAVRAPGGSERVLLTNVGSVARTIGVGAAGTHGTGSLSFLSAKSLGATVGATLAGMHLDPRTGELTGTQRVTPVKPNAKGVYAVKVPAHAAAILTLGT
jgi:hypothetical protein